jgi:hypothetical protein
VVQDTAHTLVRENSDPTQFLAAACKVVRVVWLPAADPLVSTIEQKSSRQKVILRVSDF